MRALGPLSITCKGFPSDHSSQVQRVECDELRCCEFERKSVWEAEELVVGAGRGQRPGLLRGHVVHTEAPGHPGQRPD